MIEHTIQPKESRTGIDPWSVADLPPSLPLRGLNVLGAVGPGIIILGVSIGSGEWLLGPAAFVKYGLALLWVTTVAIVLQTIFNTEVIRYTLYTGEPIFTGFMRTKPGVNFWGIFYAILFFLQVGWPVWAGAAATAIFYLFLGRLPRAADGAIVYAIGVGTFLLCVAILLFGRRIERTLETFNWILVLLIVTGLAALCVILAPPTQWASVLLGLIGFDTRTRAFDLFPAGADWFLIGAFAAYSGAGGMVNLMIASWARDKGYGMGRIVGFIPAAIGGQRCVWLTPAVYSRSRRRIWRGGASGGASSRSINGSCSASARCLVWLCLPCCTPPSFKPGAILADPPPPPNSPTRLPNAAASPLPTWSRSSARGSCSRPS